MSLLMRNQKQEAAPQRAVMRSTEANVQDRNDYCSTEIPRRYTEGVLYQTPSLHAHLTRGCQQVDGCQQHPASTGFFTLIDLQELDNGPTCSLYKTKGKPVSRGKSLKNLKQPIKHIRESIIS